MTAADRLDALADAAALTRAVREGDLTAREVILSSGDCQGIALALAFIMSAITRLADSRSGDGASPLLDGWQSDIRQAMVACDGQ